MVVLNEELTRKLQSGLEENPILTLRLFKGESKKVHMELLVLHFYCLDNCIMKKRQQVISILEYQKFGSLAGLEPLFLVASLKNGRNC